MFIVGSLAGSLFFLFVCLSVSHAFFYAITPMGALQGRNMRSDEAGLGEDCSWK